MVHGACGGYGGMGAGAGPYGAGGTGIVSAAQRARNAVDVVFLDPPRAFDPAALNDALNASNWSVRVIDPFGSVVRLAQHVEQIDSLTVRVLFDGPLSSATTYEIEVAQAVVSSQGVPLLCRCATFVTGQVLRQLRAAELQQLPQDIANPFTERDAGRPGAPLQTYQVDDRGDIGRDSGLPNLRKRVLRRATVQRGAFFHLRDYGFRPAPKQLTRPDDRKRLAREAEAQIRREPDVRQAEVVVTQSVPGVVTYRIRVEPLTGESITLILPVQLE